ncbi:MAG: dipeptide ABC transporter ATP-binding protein [Ferruginibacter sp.]
MWEIANLCIRFKENGAERTVVNNLHFTIKPGAITALIGESGSGKTLTAFSFMRLLPQQATVTGSISLQSNNPIPNLLTLEEKVIQSIRGNRIAMIFQEPMTALNPLMTCGKQVCEVLTTHCSLSFREASEKTIALFQEVDLPDPASLFKKYPHEISGGQKQRVMIAAAIACEPDLLIADEPTTALDALVQQHIVALIKRLQQKRGMSVLFISHDLPLVQGIADDVLVMYQGRLVEQGSAYSVLTNPQHAYTKALIACRPTPTSKGMPLPTMDDQSISFRTDTIGQPINMNEPETTPLLSVEALTVSYPADEPGFFKKKKRKSAIHNINLEVQAGEIVGIVGESGCGKSTLAKTILGLIEPDSGTICLSGLTTTAKSRREVRTLQMVFQDPYGSLNPAIPIGAAIREPIRVHALTPASETVNRVVELLESVGLHDPDQSKYPHAFSGGQRQRISIARALALEPRLLVFDESVSALDPGIQAQILNLIIDLRQKHHFGAIFITHDLAVAHYISDRLLVMQSGEIVEQGHPDEVLFRPKHPYTRQLAACLPHSFAERE